MTSPPVPSLAALRAPVVFVTGKGGVGKTTVAATIAYTSHQQGLRSCLVEFDDGQAGQRALGSALPHVGHVIVRYDKALVSTLSSILGTRILARALVSHPALRKLISAVPSLREFTFLDHVRELVQSYRYDQVVVDLPASGHAVDWLRVPSAFSRFLGRSPMGNVARSIHNEVIAPTRSEMVVVTLAEAFVVKETECLCQQLRRKLDIVPTWLVVNRVVQPDPENVEIGLEQLCDRLAGEIPQLYDAAQYLATVLQTRREQAQDTSDAVLLAQSIRAQFLVTLPNLSIDPDAIGLSSLVHPEKMS